MVETGRVGQAAKFGSAFYTKPVARRGVCATGLFRI
jgi:hypothetical protein